jgi:beta-galactosidase
VLVRYSYATVTDLNEAWGNVFWSMSYNTFDDVQFPVTTVTEANPSHWLDYYRFASDAVIYYNKVLLLLIIDGIRCMNCCNAYVMLDSG